MSESRVPVPEGYEEDYPGKRWVSGRARAADAYRASAPKEGA